MFLRNRFAQGFFCFVAACGFATAITASAEEGHSSGETKKSPAETAGIPSEAFAGRLSEQSQVEALSQILKKIEPRFDDQFACMKSLAEAHKEGLTKADYKLYFADLGAFNKAFFSLGKGYYGIRIHSERKPRIKDDKEIFEARYLVTNGKVIERFDVEEMSPIRDKNTELTFAHRRIYTFKMRSGERLTVDWTRRDEKWLDDIVKPVNGDLVKGYELDAAEYTSTQAAGDFKTLDIAELLDRYIKYSIEQGFRYYLESFRRASYKGSMLPASRRAHSVLMKHIDALACMRAGYQSQVQELDGMK